MSPRDPHRHTALLLGCVAIAYLPHLGHLPLWVGGVLAGCCGALVAVLLAGYARRVAACGSCSRHSV